MILQQNKDFEKNVESGLDRCYDTYMPVLKGYLYEQKRGGKVSPKKFKKTEEDFSEGIEYLIVNSEEVDTMVKLKGISKLIQEGVRSYESVKTLELKKTELENLCYD